jgi:rhodanese-related sulfurtransferase
MVNSHIKLLNLNGISSNIIWRLLKIDLPLVEEHIKRLGMLLIPVSLLITMTVTSGCANATNEIKSQPPVTGQINKFITPKQASDLIQRNRGNPNFVIIDDREPMAYKSGHIANAINVPYGTDFSSRIGQMDKNKTYLVYCPTGCGKTSGIMKELGFKEVYEIQGGLSAWKSQGLPIGQ